jgi:hypothetical protein
MSPSLSSAAMPALLLCATSIVGAQTQTGTSAPRETVIVHDKDVAREEPGPNRGTGESVGYYSFGARSQTKDSASVKVYYILSGAGVLTVNGDVKPLKLTQPS